jgi:AbrB family looped-hinge helix DNA binding protein
MEDDAVCVLVAPNGRLSIPARHRRDLGLEGGGMVVASVVEGELRLRPVKAMLRELREEVAPLLRSSGDSVAQFLADKKAEIARDE